MCKAISCTKEVLLFAGLERALSRGTELNHMNKLTETGVSSDSSIAHNSPL